MFKNKEDFKKSYQEKIIETYGRDISFCHDSEKYLVLAQMIREYASINWKNTRNSIRKHQNKQLFYFSMEFLIGRLLTSNMMNLGIYDVVKAGLNDLHIDINALEEIETDAGLGNGGLGRLAACFLDSLATLSLSGNGNTIRYQYGLFKQLIKDDKQVEVPDIWLKYGYPWEIRKSNKAVDITFYGHLETNWNNDGKMEVRHLDGQVVSAVPYDVAIIGKDNGIVNTLRLWQPEASEAANTSDFISYIRDVNMISQNVYPDDSTQEGRILRIKQEYFFVSAGVQTILKDHYETYHTFDNLPDKVVIQLNDTHPIMVIPEMMRILLDEYQYDWDKAWSIVSRSVAYTNHTIMSEALEKWPVSYLSSLLPRIYALIEEIDRRFRYDVYQKTNDADLANRVAIIKDGFVHMSALADATVFSINGVAKIHSEILKNDTMKDFYRIFPEKFNNKTNGVTHRRWLLYSNPQLTALLKKTIGDGFINDATQLIKLKDHVNDKKLIKQFREVKYQRKLILADYVKKNLGIEVDPNSIFDVQAKRLHAYKRQLLNCLNIIYLYQQLKSNKDFKMVPTTFFFSAKAAPSYTFAKKVIELINKLSKVINNDEEVNKYIKVVFIPNYSVSVAEILLNAADISQQISTAGKEASGTGNMKLMMNGAVTLGTLDGANVEIKEKVGDENIVIFGHTVEQLAQLRRSYKASEIYNNNPNLKKALDSLIDASWSKDNSFKAIFDELFSYNDEYFVLADFDSYVKAHKYIQDLYLDYDKFASMCLRNIAESGYFSSDRTIAEYNRDIWHLEKIK